MITLEEELLINRTAQGYDPFERAEDWFRGLDQSRRQEALLRIWRLAQQAGWREYADVSDTLVAAQELGLDVAELPASRFARRSVDELSQQAVLDTPATEQMDQFRLLLRVLSIADRRRRSNRCKGQCSHWWHQDLNDPDLLARLRTIWSEEQRSTK